jgi:ATP-binding cassette subfamily B protein
MLNKNSKSGFNILLNHIYRHKKYVGWGVLSLLGVDVLQVTVPRITQYVIDQLTKDTATYQKLFICGGGIIIIALIIGFFRFLWRYFLVGASRKIEREIRQDIYNHLQILSPEFYDKQKVGDITAHATNDVQAIQRSAGFGTLAAFDAVVLGTLSIANMIYTSPSLALITLLPLPIVTLVVIKFGKLVHFRFDKVQNAFSKLTEKAQETISGIRVVKAYGDEKTEQKYFTEKAGNCADENIKLAKIQAIFDPAISGLAMVSLALLLWFGGKRVITGQLSIGEFVAFASYIGMLTWPMIAIGVVVNLVQRGAASMERIQSILDTEPTINDGNIDVEPSSNIKCENLNFTYPGTDVEVLKNINFEIKENSTLGIVGRTGSGKTTIIELLMRLYDVSDGTISFGDYNITDLKLLRVRGKFGYVPQEPFLFAMTIAENISFGNKNISREKIEDAAQTVRIHDEIISFPDGYETEVGERGITLSGGQKQRIAIARALAANPDILILDDALSAVDAETETAILENLKAEIKSRTNIIIAHRISAVKDADNILVINNGTIEDAGKHFDLIHREGYYSELYRLQSLEEKLITE